jgi:hypothetical protein
VSGLVVGAIVQGSGLVVMASASVPGLVVMASASVPGLVVGAIVQGSGLVVGGSVRGLALVALAVFLAVSYSTRANKRIDRRFCGRQRPWGYSPIAQRRGQ